jgi:hypothetical protein
MTTSDVINAFSATESKLSSLEQRLTPARWTQSPTTGGWSPLQNIEHLNLISKEFLKRFEIASSQLASKKGGSLKMELIGKLLTRALSSKGRMLKMKSPPHFVPQNVTDASSVLSTFHQNQQDLLSFIRSNANASIDSVKITSPFDERFKYSIFSALNILSAEQERHFRQIERGL